MKKVLIITFCCWHMFCVLMYCYGANLDRHTMALLFKKENEEVWIPPKFRQIVRPYMLLTSQWQRWNIFSPDPLRRNAHFLFDVQNENSWRTFYQLTPQTTGWWRRAFMLKIMRRLEDKDRNTHVRERLAQLQCIRSGIRPGRIIRIRRRYYVTPKTPDLSKPEFWSEYTPEWHEDILLETTCPQKLT